MSSHDLTVLGYLLLLAVGVALEVLSAWPRTQIPSLQVVLTRIMRSRTGRVGVLIAWAWVGLHFFARLPGQPHARRAHGTLLTASPCSGALPVSGRSPRITTTGQCA